MTTPPSLVFARQPPASSVAPSAVSQRGCAVHHRQAIQVAPVVGRERRNEARTPARPKAALDVERAKAGKAGVDEPAFVVGAERHLVNVDVAGDVVLAIDIDRVMSPGRLEALGDGRDVAKLPDAGFRSDQQPVATDGEPHRLGEMRKMRVDGGAIRAHRDEVAALVVGDEQRGVEEPKDLRQIVRVHAREARVVGRGAGNIRRRSCRACGCG